jgi:hypothetical protein
VKGSSKLEGFVLEFYRRGRGELRNEYVAAKVLKLVPPNTCI